MPPDITDWLMAPRLSITVVQAVWPYIVLPLDFILGIRLVTEIFSTIRYMSKV